MFLIHCPWCGARDQSEFSCHGEAHIVRPPNPEQLSEPAWGDYVFFRKNPKGIHHERWVHSHGCRRWFNVVRDTRNDRIHATYQPGDPIPEVPDAPDAPEVGEEKTS